MLKGELKLFDTETKAQLAQYLELLEKPVVFKASLDESENSKKVATFLEEVAAMSPKISIVKSEGKRTPSFTIDPSEGTSGITFAGLPMGHEFTSFILALLQVGGRAPKVDPETIARIKEVKGPFAFETFVSLTCHNCPDVVQA